MHPALARPRSSSPSTCSLSTFPGLISAGPHRWPVQLTVDSDAVPATVPALGFVLVTVTFDLPPGLTGTVELTLDEPALLRAVLAIAHGPEARHRFSRFRESARPAAITHLTRHYASNFDVYEPMYFLYGSDTPAANDYGESLLDYNQDTETIRAGFALVR